MAPIIQGLASDNNNDMLQLPCEVAFTGTYPPLSWMQDPKASGTIRQREVDLSNNAATVVNPNPTSWSTQAREIIDEPRTWVAVVVGLLLLTSVLALCYQWYKGSKERRRRRDEGKRIGLPSMYRSNSFVMFKQRKERKAAWRHARRDHERVSQTIGGVQTLGVVFGERELHDPESSHENLVDSVESLLLQDSDYPQVQYRSDLGFRQPTVTHSCHAGGGGGTWQRLVGNSPFAPASVESGSRVSMPPRLHTNHSVDRFSE